MNDFAKFVVRKFGTLDFVYYLCNIKQNNNETSGL